MIRMPATMYALSLRRFQSSCEIVIEKGAVEFYEVCALSMNARREGRTGVRPSLAAAISMIVCALRKWSHWSAPLPRRRYLPAGGTHVGLSVYFERITPKPMTAMIATIARRIFHSRPDAGICASSCD